MILQRIKLFLVIALLGLVTVSCKDKEEDDPTTEVFYYNMLLDAGQPSDSEAAITKDMTWKVGDQLAALNLLYDRNVAVLNYDGSKFGGKVPSISSGGTIGYFYPVSAVPQTTSDTTHVRINLMLQDGVYAEPYLAGSAGSKTEGDNATATVKMSPVNAIANLVFEHEGQPIDDITHVEISAYKGSLYGQADYELKTLSYTTKKTANISVVNADLDGGARIIMLPTNGVALAVTVITTDGRAFVGRHTKTAAVEAGQEYTYKFECKAEEGTAKIGDYFYSDFTRSSEYDETKTCVGIVFALTEKEGGEINNSLTSSNHGRVVALKDVGKAMWANSSAQVYDVAGLTNYEKVDGTNESGYLPFHKDNEGNVGYHAEANVKLMVDLNENGSIKQWYTTGALSDFRGDRNTELTDTSLTKLPASYKAANFNLGGLNGWYLPSMGEMALIYAQCGAGIIGSQEGFVELDNFSYWTSTECSKSHAWVIQAFNGRVFPNFKTSLYSVRPVLKF